MLDTQPLIFTSLKNRIEEALRRDCNVLVEGSPGSVKTWATTAALQATGRAVFSAVLTPTTDDSTLVQGLQLTPEGGTTIVAGPALLAAESAARGVPTALHFTELQDARSTTVLRWLTALADPWQRCLAPPLSPGVELTWAQGSLLVVAEVNPPYSLPTPLLDRLLLVVAAPVTTEAMADHLRSRGLPDRECSAVAAVAAAFNKAVEMMDSDGPPITLRALDRYATFRLHDPPSMSLEAAAIALFPREATPGADNPCLSALEARLAPQCLGARLGRGRA